MHELFTIVSFLFTRAYYGMRSAVNNCYTCIYYGFIAFTVGIIGFICLCLFVLFMIIILQSVRSNVCSSVQRKTHHRIERSDFLINGSKNVLFLHYFIYYVMSTIYALLI